MQRGRRMWLRSLPALALLALTVTLARPASADPDAPGSKDPALFNRMPGYVISEYDDKAFDTHAIRDAKLQEQTVEGHVTYVKYRLSPGTQEPSRAQVLRNYEHAVQNIGGKVLYSDYDGSSYLEVSKDGAQVWVHVDAYITDEYKVWVIVKQAMAQDVVANAAALAGDLARTGHVAVPGIYFATNKADLDPRSATAIAEIAKLLAADPSLTVAVVGHTDAVGGVDANLKLSQARAGAVVAELVGKHRIAAARLKPYGVSSLAPVAPNDSEEGRAKNRRVELVKQSAW